jgi:positive regulator of sigma E activity
MKVINAIANTAWRLVSMVGILLAGIIMVVVSKDHVVEGYYEVISLIFLATAAGFAILQSYSKDVIEIKSRKERLDE